jgi:RNA polymerase sigma-70 factor (ECF subfamily)
MNAPDLSLDPDRAPTCMCASAEPDPAAEAATIRRAMAGDETAFEELIRAYSRRVYVVAYAILQDVSDAEDLVQDVFLKVHQNRAGLREPEKFPAWLMTVTRNGARDRLRRRRPQAEVDAAMEDRGAVTPGSELEREEKRRDLRRALRRLPETHRQALTLRYLEGRDHRFIETTLGLSNGALRGILGRALATLRETPGLDLYTRNA